MKIYYDCKILYILTMNNQEQTNLVYNVLIITELTKEISKKLSKDVVEYLSTLKEFVVFSES